MFNPLESSACLKSPRWQTDTSAWTWHLPVALALVEALKPSVFVELGTHRGDSYCAFCQAVLDLKLTARCYAVDTWQGDEHSGLYDGNVLQELRQHHDPCYGHFSTLLQLEFDAARQQFPDGTVDLLHIDGYHTYEAVRHDFECWQSALSDRGVALFHDILVREHDFGVWKLWEELCQRYEHFEMTQEYGLGVLLVGPEQPSGMRDLADAARHSAGFQELFTVLGDRLALKKALWQHGKALTSLQAELASTHAPLANQQAENARQQEQIAQLQAEIARQQEDLARQQAELELQRQANGRLSRELAYYEQFRFRLAERLNQTLRKTGPLHTLAKQTLQGSARLAGRSRNVARS